MKIKYPRFYISDQPTEFYVFYQESEDTPSMWSGWIIGDANLWYKIKNMKKKDQQAFMVKLADKKN